jgi:uncharacterized secreted protein with C-terminal beta-propeller domain
MSARSLLCLSAVLSAAALAGCTAGEKPRPSTPPAAMRLVAFDSCAQLRDDLRTAAAASVGPYGFPGNGGIGLDAVAAGGARTAMDSGTAIPEKAVPFSTTNTHEPDADEPDIVKTDGRRIVTVTGDVLRVIDPATRTETGRLDLGAGGSGGANLLLSGDKALVLVSGVYGYKHVDRVADRLVTSPQLLLVDLAGAPRVVSRYRAEGTLVDARQTGSTARVVLRTSPRIKFPELPNASNDGVRAEANRAAVQRAPADAWLPSWSVTTGGVTESGSVGCDRVSRPPDYSGAAMLTILTFDLGTASLGSGDPMSIVADGDTVYGTGTSLYVANDQRWRLDLLPQRSFQQRTDIYRFDVTGTRAPTLTASGSVPGWLINQYALSDWDGHLRVATTDDRAGSSAVRVLSQRGRDLVQVGVVNGLGRGERIYSVRFIGPRGYVVTFKQTDPLYSLDLSDPGKPRVTGELKITGYSAHLQPVGDDRLVGIGQEASTDGRIQGTQVSLFDVSDPAAPRRLAQYHLSGAMSEAEWDPHALLWWPATGLLVVPVMNGYDATAPGALALRVTGNGLAQVGTIRPPSNDAVRRSLVVGNVLWTLSDTGLQASDLSTMDRLSWLPWT